MGPDLTNFNEFLACVRQHFSTKTDASHELKSSLAGVESYLSTGSLTTGEVQTLHTVGNVYTSVVDFLNDQNLFSNQQFTRDLVNGVEHLKRESVVGGELTSLIPSLESLCQSCNVPALKMAGTVTSLANLIRRYSQSPNAVRVEHWANHRKQVNSNYLFGAETMMPRSALGHIAFGDSITVAGAEAFGANIDQVLPDLRMAMTITLLRPNKGLMSRIMHTRTATCSVIRYVINYDEFYSLTAAGDVSGEVRNGYEHRTPMLDLLRNPAPISMELKKLTPLKANDTKGYLVSDGVIKFDNNVDLFDLSLKPTVQDGVNYSDLVSEGVVIDTIYIALKKTVAGVPVREEFAIPVSTVSSARLMMMANTSDSGDRGTNMKTRYRLRKDITTLAGAANTLLKDVAEPDLVILDLFVAASISLKTSVAKAVGTANISAGSMSENGEASDAIKTILTGMTVELVGYSLDARHSEENLRRTDSAFRSNVATRDYEIGTTPNTIVDYSFQQVPPEHVLNTAQDAQMIGLDYRNLEMFKRTLAHIHDRIISEATDKQCRINYNGSRINNDYVAGWRVNPYVFIGSLDASETKSVRHSDILSDLRQYVEAYLNMMHSELNRFSLFTAQCESTCAPVYKVITTNIILENVLSLPHIHASHIPGGNEGELVYQKKDPNAPIEYVRTLPNGVRLECVSTFFETMENKIILFPYLPDNPESDLNFGHNWDYGQFVAHYTPNEHTQVVKRVFQNVRQQPVITCPIGAIITINNLEKVLPNIHAVV